MPTDKESTQYICPNYQGRKLYNSKQAKNSHKYLWKTCATSMLILELIKLKKYFGGISHELYKYASLWMSGIGCKYEF